jgi:acetolactate synthase I/II/III large subunit
MPNLNRREALGVLGATASVLPALASGEAQGGRVELGPYVRREGVRGKMTGAQAAAAALRCAGVPCVFGIPGAQNNEFWDALKARRVPYMLVAHEASASVMADASARATGGVGVFSVVPGPGLTNTMTGIGEAFLDSIPIVGIITDVDRSPGAPIGQVHSLPNVALLRPLVKALIEVRHQAEIPNAIFQAFQIAKAGEPGPVAVVIPFPLFSQAWDFDQGLPPPMPVPFDEACYRQVVAHLADRRKRVGIYAGLGCVDAVPSLIRVAEILQAPVATSVSGKGVIPDGHPLAVGWGYGKQGTRAAEHAFHDVDLVLAVGVRYSEVSTANYAIPKHDTLIHVDANPQNLGRNVCAQVKLCADAPLFLNRLIGDAPTIQRPHCPALHTRLAGFREIDRCQNAQVRVPDSVDPMIFFNRLRCLLGPDELIFVDVTASTHWASEAISVPGPRRYFTPSDNQSMGWAARPPRRLDHRRRLLSHVGHGDVERGARESARQVLRPRRRRLPLHADAPGAGLPPDHRHRDRPHRLRRLRPRRRTGVQRGPRQPRDRRRDPELAGHTRPGSHARHRELRRPRDPLAQRPPVDLHPSPPQRPEGPAGGARRSAGVEGSAR